MYNGGMEEKLKHITALDGFNPDEVQRFLEKVRIQGDKECWIWVYYCDPRGYGKFTRRTGKSGGAQVPAHRFSHELFIGPIPPGFQVHHKCDNPSCVKPDHLEALSIPDHVAKTTGHHATKTHCHLGHEFTLENTRLYNGFRNCRACVRLRMKRRFDPHYVETGALTDLYCVNNHPLFGENMHLVEIAYGRFRRYCKACRREASERHATENQEAILTAKTLRRADVIAARKLRNRQAIISLRQTAHLLPAKTLILTLRRLLNDCD